MTHDVCIVGAGAAGLTLARDLARRGRTVVLVEGAGAERARHDVGTIGRAHRGVIDGHALALGGTTTLWGGQLWPWEPYEFGPRPHVPGWPFGYDDLAPFYREAQEALGVTPGPFDGRLARARGIDLPPLDPSRFAYKYSKWARWRDRNLGRTLGPPLLKHPAVEVILGETAVEIETGGAGVSGVRTRGTGGVERTVVARTYVLAGGVLGTVGLLLASGTGGGLGNGSGHLGRGFMDHLSVRMGRFEARDPRQFARAFAPFYADGVLHTPRIVAQPALLDAEAMTGVYGHWEPVLPSDSGLATVREALRAVQAGRRPKASLADLGRVLSDVPDAVRVAYGIGVRRRRPFPGRAQIHLRVDVEQLPTSVLSHVADASGDGGRLALDWRVSDTERQTVRRFAELLAAELDRLGVGTLHVEDPFDDAVWGDRVTDAYHMMGGTRMSASASEGVVDPHLQLHGVENLYVASASVFPSGGMANPTLTILALALRLGHHLDHSVL